MVAGQMSVAWLSKAPLITHRSHYSGITDHTEPIPNPEALVFGIS